VKWRLAVPPRVGRMFVSQLTLYESRLSQACVEYRTVESFPLKTVSDSPENPTS